MTVRPGSPPARRLRAEVLIVLGLSLGQSAVYAILRLIDRLTEAAPLAAQTAAMNTSDSPKPWLDLLYQLAGSGFAVLPAVLALYLLAVRPPASQSTAEPAPASPRPWPGPTSNGQTVGAPRRAQARSRSGEPTVKPMRLGPGQRPAGAAAGSAAGGRTASRYRASTAGMAAKP
ncbi:MAG: hypothetical protein LBD70_06025, partial [Bifidobacteriaceae bacterium]|nr:hypothetical protein [Bifidobacteriaceae bacterium]